jgi:hypothetical protein
VKWGRLLAHKEIHSLDFNTESRKKYFKPQPFEVLRKRTIWGNQLPGGLSEKDDFVERQEPILACGFGTGSKNTITGKAFFSELSVDALEFKRSLFHKTIAMLITILTL